MAIKNRRASAFLAGVLTFWLASCGDSSPPQKANLAGSWDEIVVKAKQEGSVSLYAAMAAQSLDRLSKAFAKDYPDIKLETLRLVTSELAQRADAEQAGNAAGADVLINTDRGWQKLRNQKPGFFKDFVGPNLSTAAVSDFKLLDDRAIIVGGTAYGFAWSNRLGKDKVVFTDVLEDPAFKGRIGLPDYTASATLLLQYHWLEEQYGKGVLEKLARQNPKYYIGVGPLAQALAAGEIDFSTNSSSPSIENLPAKIAYAKKPYALPYFASIPGWTQHPNAAQVFANWALTPAGQEAIGLGDVSAMPNVKGALFSEADITPFSTAAVDNSFIDELRKRVKTIFGR